MLIRDHFQNYKSYQLPKAQLIIADVPYNLGNNAYASNPAWYKEGDNKNGESELAGKSFFDTDANFRPAEFMHFCSTMMKPEPKAKSDAPGRAKRIVKHEDIIWSCVRPNRKSFSIVWRPEENLIASTGFAVITAQKIPSTFLYQLITENEFVGYLENNAKGAAYPAVTAKDFEDGFIKIPSNTILEDYHSEISPCFELKYILQNQNTKLREARDNLLPKLMNGQIEV
jgi:hypothetical protein